MSKEIITEIIPECVQDAMPFLESAKTFLIKGGFWSKDSEMGVIVGPFIQRTCLSESAFDLLEALQELIAVAEANNWDNAEIHNARAAIAKATGGKK